MSVPHLQEKGRDAYKRGDYAKALEHFNRAIGRGNPTPQLLDSLARTYIKLDDPSAALQTAKKAIRAGPEDPTGYLRAGVVLKKMRKLSVALEIYAHGLKQVKHVGLGYEHLKQAHDELMKELAPMNSVDPLTMLPRELAVVVLEYLTFRERIAVCRVSKGWTRFIQSEPNLWTHLDLSGAKSKVRTSFISVAINKAKSKLTTATLNRLWDHDKVLASLVKFTPMTRLTLLETGLQGQNLFNILCKADKLTELRILRGTEVGENGLMQIVNSLQSNLKLLHCAYLTRLDFRLATRWQLLFPKLETINLTAAQVDGVDRFFNELARSASELRSVTFHQGGPSCIPSRIVEPTHIDVRNCRKLEHVDLRLGFRSARQIQLPPSVRELHLSTSLGGELACHFFSVHDVAGADPNALALSDLPRLEKLSLKMSRLNFSDVANEFGATQRIVGDAAQLANLNSLIMDEPSTSELGQFGFGLRLTKLEQLGLRYTQELKDEHVERIAQQLKCLTTLDLSGTAITGIAVRSIMKAGQVKELIVNDCQNLGRDAVDLARSQGMKVVWRNSIQETAGGKKVRY